MPANESLIKAAGPLAERLMPRERFDIDRRVEQAIANDGRVIDDAPPFRRYRSPDGSIWRQKIDNAGNTVNVKES